MHTPFMHTAILLVALSTLTFAAPAAERLNDDALAKRENDQQRVTSDKAFFRNPIFSSTPGKFDTAKNGNPPIQGNNPSKFKNESSAAYPAPFTPAGGNMIPNPEYFVASEFDYQSLIVGIHQEMAELDLFHNALARFSVEEFEAAGLGADERFLIQHMADQEVGHALLLTNMVGADRAPKQCTYQYPFKTVKEFILFAQLLTRFGEAGVYGFLSHLDARPVAQMLIQSITVEARQQMSFRQMQGLAAQPEWFETGLPQAYQWTLLQKYIKSCPSNNPHINFQIFPDLLISNQPDALQGHPGINSNYSLGLTEPGREIRFTWDEPGKVTGYDGLYKTSTVAGEPVAVAWISGLNVTYTDIYDRNGNSAATKQPDGAIYPPFGPAIANSVFVSLVSEKLFLTPYNLTSINNITVAGPAMYQAS